MRYFSFLMMATLCCAVGCRTYVIDSNPKGLRVALDDLEQGVTPCEITVMIEEGHSVTVAPPTNRQLRTYEKEKNVVVSTWLNGTQSKYIRHDAPSGTMFFEFITSEYDRPNSDEEWAQLRRDLEHDAAELDKKRQNILKLEVPAKE